MRKLAVITRRKDGLYEAILWKDRQPVAEATEPWGVLLRSLRAVGLCLRLREPLVPILPIDRPELGLGALTEHQPTGGHAEHMRDPVKFGEVRKATVPLLVLVDQAPDGAGVETAG